jgi:hypothetical protein
LCWAIQPPKSFRKRCKPISLSITSHNYGTWRSLEALNVSWDEVLALVLNVSD